MNVLKGDRVQIVSCSESERIDWSEISTLTGIVADYRHDIISIVLDNPCNKAPTEEESQFAQHSLATKDAHQVLRCSVDGTVCTKLSDFPSPTTMIRCTYCGQYNFRKSILLCCKEFRHYCCIKHIMPVLRGTDTPDLTAITIMKEHFRRYAMQQHITEKYDVDTRALLAYESYMTASTHRERDDVIDDFSKFDLWTCFVCRNRNRDRCSTTSFRFINDQLFPWNENNNGESNQQSRLRNTISSPRRKFPLLYDRLERLGYMTADIDSLVKDNDPEDVDHWDLEFAKALLASRSVTLGVDQQHTHDMENGDRTTSINSLNPNRFIRSTPIGKTIQLRLFSPELNKSLYVIFPPETTHRALVYYAVTKLDLGCLPSDLILHRVDASGWSVEVAAEGEKSPSCISLADLEINDTISFRRVIAGHIGPRMVLVNSIDKFNEAMVAKFATLAETYVGLRKIRGDGNCYYRAVIVGLLEHIMRTGERQKFKSLHGLLAKSIISKSGDHPDPIETLLNMILEASAEDGERWRTWEEVEADILNVNSNGIDEALIRACRRLVAQYLLKHQNIEVNGMPLKDIILSCYENVTDMLDYCKQYVTKMGVDAEGPFIELGLLPLTLGCRCTIIYLDRIQGNELKAFESGLGANEPLNQESKETVAPSLMLGHVHLLLRPGHYDLLYLETPIPPTYRSLKSDEEVEVATISPSVTTNKLANPVSASITPTNPEAVSDTTATSTASLDDNGKVVLSLPSSSSPPGSPKRPVDNGDKVSSNESQQPLPEPPPTSRIHEPLNPPPAPPIPTQKSSTVRTPTIAPQQTTVQLPYDSIDKQEMSRQLCEILSITNAEALDLCKQYSTVESAVSSYYEAQEAKKRHKRKNSFSSMIRNSLGRGKDRDRLQQIESEHQAYLDQHVSTTADHAYQPNPRVDNRQVSHLRRLIGVSEDEAKSLLLRFNGSITDAADYYQGLLAEDLQAKPTASTIASNLEETFGKTERPRSSSHARMLSFSRIFGKSPAQSSPQYSTDSKPLPPHSVARDDPLHLSSIYRSNDAGITMVEGAEGEVIVSYNNPARSGLTPTSLSPPLSPNSSSRSRSGFFNWMSPISGSTSPIDRSPRGQEIADVKADSKSTRSLSRDRGNMFSIFKSKRKTVPLKVVEDVLRLDRDDVAAMDMGDCKKALTIILGHECPFKPTASQYREELISRIENMLRERSQKSTSPSDDEKATRSTGMNLSDKDSQFKGTHAESK